jgi:hypothetical protein
MHAIDGIDVLSQKLNANFAELTAADETLDEDVQTAQDDATLALSAGIPFMVTGKLVASTAGTAVHLVPAASVPAGKKIHIRSFLLNVSGSTAWTDSTATKVILQDTAASPVLAFDIAKAVLTTNKVIDSFGATSVTAYAPVLTGAGLTAAKGLDIKADANFAAGSDIYVTVSGYIY